MKPVQEYVESIVSEMTQTLDKLSHDEFEIMIKSILDAQKVFISGVGRSGFAVKAFAMRLMHLGIDAFIIGETTTPRCTVHDFLLIASASGNTESLVALANKAEKIGTPVGLISTRSVSEIAHVAQKIIILPAPSPKVKNNKDLNSCQPMGSLFVQALWITLDALVLCLMEELDKDADMMFARHANLE
ncbi:MAG: 6-phospho-3-hexuloisomerase [SAR324 cluster bacterium]|nr:6-phospho-3-hexuloisomerase [SAR324 cluster bacterium]